MILSANQMSSRIANSTNPGRMTRRLKGIDDKISEEGIAGAG